MKRLVSWGIDDWHGVADSATERSVDLETNNVVDLLPDREKDTLSGWPADHPGVEIIDQDRPGAYARGARDGAPNAL